MRKLRSIRRPSANVRALKRCRSRRSAWLTTYEDRIPLFHVKDGIPNPAGGFFNAGFTDLGDGVIDFQRLFTALRKRGVHHYIAERDTQPHPAETARKGYAYLRDLRAE